MLRYLHTCHGSSICDDKLGQNRTLDIFFSLLKSGKRWGQEKKFSYFAFRLLLTFSETKFKTFYSLKKKTFILTR